MLSNFYDKAYLLATAFNNFAGEVQEEERDYLLTFDMAAPESMVIL